MALSNLQNLSDLAKRSKKAAEADSDRLLTLNVDDLFPKDQVRKHFSGIEELAASLVREGQIQPVVVSPPNAEGKYQIQKGERRWRACKHAGLETIEAIVNDREQTDLDETAGELIENIQREDLTPIEIGAALTLFVEAGWKQKDIAERIGKSIPFVSTHLSLLRAPEEVQALCRNGLVQDTETLNNLRQLHELDPAACASACDEAFNGGISRQRTRSLLIQARTGGEVNPGNREDDVQAPLTSEEPKQEPDLERLGWTPVKAAKVRIQCDAGQGTLLTNRKDNDPGYIWVQLDGVSEPLRLCAQEVSLLGLK